MERGELRMWLYNGQKFFTDLHFVFLEEETDTDNRCKILCDGTVYVRSTSWVFCNSIPGEATGDPQRGSAG
jgi:hypothetical protein